MIIDENYLYINTSDPILTPHITKLLASIRTNPHERIGLDTVYTLRSPIILLPQPKTTEKAVTKWSAFAEKRGIEQKKKSFFVNDENNNENENTEEKGHHRYGALSKRNLELRGGIYVDKTYSKTRREKIKRVKKNVESMKKNKERNNNKK